MTKPISLSKKIDVLTSIVQKGFASADKKFTALAGDIADIRETMPTKEDPRGMATKEDTKEILGHVMDMHAQMNNVEAEIKPLTRARLPERMSATEIQVFGGSKAPRVSLPKA
jgi:hypothetical protein